MPESSLSLTYDALRAEVGYFLGYGRESADWTQDQALDIESCVQSGLRQFYHPTIAGRPTSHDWSFLKPVTSIALAAGQVDYDLPDDFGSILGDFYHQTEDQTYCEVRVRGESMIRKKRASCPATTGAPRLAAIRPKKSTGVVGQRQELLIWPEPDDGDYTLNYRYRVLPAALDEIRKHPYGGMAHAETLLESCLAVAEHRIDDLSGGHGQKFMERLLASIGFDSQNEPDKLGYNGDRSDVTKPWLRRHENWSPVSHGGFR